MREALRPIALLALAVALAACGGASETEEPAATAEAGDEPASAPAEASGADACPPDSEIAEVVGQPVSRQLGGSICFYQTADFEFSVSVMRITPSEADQLEQEMAATPTGEVVEPIDVGDRGSVWGSPGYGQGYVIEGNHGWKTDVHDSSAGSTDKREEVVRILEHLIE